MQWARRTSFGEGCSQSKQASKGEGRRRNIAQQTRMRFEGGSDGDSTSQPHPRLMTCGREHSQMQAGTLGPVTMPVSPATRPGRDLCAACSEMRNQGRHTASLGTATMAVDRGDGKLATSRGQGALTYVRLRSSCRSPPRWRGWRC